ncbi:hypothetical protein AB0N31_10485 [Streptomyces sp. NPDC051051]|uniref:hypothetical protein n=1 Tax=Streptomyces sp. NPDC051051 TaxID=3155666 RepID=UPI003435A6FB
MSNFGQLVAALAGGALLGIAAVLVVNARDVERRAERQRRIDTAVQAIVAGVESYRRDWPPDVDSEESGADASVEVYAKAHLRLLIRPAAAPSTASSRPQRSSRPTPVRRRSRFQRR